MKKRILLETVQIDRNKELAYLNQGKLNSLLSGSTPVILSQGPDGSASAVVPAKATGARIYTYGLPFKNSKGLTFYCVYDGAVLTVADNKYSYYVKDGAIQYFPNWPYQNMEDVYTPLLASMELTNTQDVYGKLKQYKNKFQELINQGAQGNFFNEFNNILDFFYPNDTSYRLQPTSGSSFYDIVDKQELETNYKPFDVTRFGLKSKSIIYLPKKASGIMVKPMEDKVDANSCQTWLKDYFVAGLNQMTGSEITLQGKQLEDYKARIANCYTKGMYQTGKFDGFERNEIDQQFRTSDDPFAPKKRSRLAKLFGAKDRPDKILGFEEILKILNNSSVYNLRHIDTKRKAAFKESTMILNKIIKEQLVEVTENKKRKIQESKIVDTRFKILLESSNIRTKKGLNDLYVNLLAEMIYLHKQGFDSNIIKENAVGVFGVLSNLFGSSTGSIIDTFKEKGVEWIMGRLGLKDNSYLKNFLITTLGNTDLTDVPKLFTDCSFLTKKVAESVPEAYLRKLEYEKGLGNAFIDVVRNSLYDVVRNSDLAQKLENNLSTVLCPLVDKMSSKFSDKLENMKSSLI